MSHPFRFGAGSAATSSTSEFAENARRTEGLGYNICLVADHFEESWFAAGPALVAAALAPQLSESAASFTATASATRLAGARGCHARRDCSTRALRETLAVVKGLWSNGPLSFSGEHYTITEMEGWPKPLQKPHPPIQVGGGGRRMLALAAQEADIVGIIAQSVKGRSAGAVRRSTAASGESQ